MARLSQLKPQVASLAPRVARPTDSHGHSTVLEPLRHLYSTAAWKKLRWATLVRDKFTCQCGCGVMLGHKTGLLVADHIKPHRGDLVLFWDPDNVQTLRKSPCHDAKKQREEAAARAYGG